MLPHLAIAANPRRLTNLKGRSHFILKRFGDDIGAIPDDIVIGIKQGFAQGGIFGHVAHLKDHHPGHLAGDDMALAHSIQFTDLADEVLAELIAVAMKFKIDHRPKRSPDLARVNHRDGFADHPGLP